MRDGGLHQRLATLAGKRLICSCSVDEACHGDAIIDFFRAHFPDARPFGLPTLAAPCDSETVADTSEEDADGVRRPKKGEGVWGRGPLLKITNFGKPKEFHDGAGLCSPGGWTPSLRSEESSGLASELRPSLFRILSGLPYKKILATLAAGRCIENPFGEDVVNEARGELNKLLRVWGPNFAPEDPAAGQPFRLKSLAALLHTAGDPDWCCF